MQEHAPEAVDLSHEDAATLELYGVNNPKTADFGRRCLLARRLVERGVRCIQLYSGGAHNDDNWDAHGDLENNHNKHAGETDQPIAALLKDLKRRGLLDSTLSFGVASSVDNQLPNMPTVQVATTTPIALRCGWPAVVSRRSQYWYNRRTRRQQQLKKPLHVKHLHATILHQLGLDPNRLSYFYSGLDQKLVGVEHVEPIREAIA